MEEDLVTPGRAITMVGLPGSNYKKVEASNLAKPGVLRNSGGSLAMDFVRTILIYVKIGHN
jgi:hypothetical protein